MVEYVSIDSARTYYVVFDTRRGARMFWHLFTRKGFDHVFLLSELKNGMTLVIKPTPSECLIEEWACTTEFAATYLKDDVVSILKYEANFSSLKVYTPRGIISCVTAVKYFLGIKAGCLTPYGLYKQLIKLGAIEYGK